MITFKERLRELRLEKGLSQQELGAIVNMSKMAISHWESGHSEPSIAQLILLSQHFEVSIDYLVGKVDFI
ncbi:MAG: helix-turn-helix transcriptional regulator [Clostridia bacterium]|nr:helix-turn-helix transcriptional regulator [Clostridia bacterium]